MCIDCVGHHSGGSSLYMTGRKRGVLNVRLCAQVHASLQVI